MIVVVVQRAAIGSKRCWPSPKNVTDMDAAAGTLASPMANLTFLSVRTRGRATFSSPSM